MLEDASDDCRITKRERGPVIVDATVHAHIFGRAHGAQYYERIIEIAANTPEIRVATRAEIANHVLTL